MQIAVWPIIISFVMCIILCTPCMLLPACRTTGVLYCNRLVVTIYILEIYKDPLVVSIHSSKQILRLDSGWGKKTSREEKDGRKRYCLWSKAAGFKEGLLTNQRMVLMGKKRVWIVCVQHVAPLQQHWELHTEGPGGLDDFCGFDLVMC